MIRVGLVDLDNSHPAAFVPLLQRTTDVRVTALFDHGDVQSRAFVERFAQEHGIAQLCASLDELVDAVDVGMIHSMNWDRHLERARPFLAAGKPVFVDKPLVGRRRDAEAWLALSARAGVQIMAGSVLRYADEVETMRAQRAAWGRIYSAFLCGPGDFFNFGSHFTALLNGFFGATFEAVTYIGQGERDLFWVEQRDEAPVIVQLSAGSGYADHPCYLALSTERGLQVVAPRSGPAMAEALVRTFAQFARTGQAPTPLNAVLGDTLVLLMAAEARRSGKRMTLADVPLDAGFDGTAFTVEYASRGGYAGSGLATRAKYVV